MSPSKQPVHNELLHPKLMAIAGELANDPGEGAQRMLWARARTALDLARPDDPEIEDSEVWPAISERSSEFLSELTDGWQGDDPLLPASDRAILKRAMKALRKRLKLARLDEESALSGRAMTDGKESTIVGVRPPEQYPAEVWQLLATQNRIHALGEDLYELV